MRQSSKPENGHFWNSPWHARRGIEKLTGRYLRIWWRQGSDIRRVILPRSTQSARNGTAYVPAGLVCVFCGNKKGEPMARLAEIATALVFLECHAVGKADHA
jgi:hypothetical protein